MASFGILSLTYSLMIISIVIGSIITLTALCLGSNTKKLTKRRLQSSKSNAFGLDFLKRNPEMMSQKRITARNDLEMLKVEIKKQSESLEKIQKDIKSKSKGQDETSPGTGGRCFGSKNTYTAHDDVEIEQLKRELKGLYQNVTGLIQSFPEQI